MLVASHRRIHSYGRLRVVGPNGDHWIFERQQLSRAGCGGCGGPRSLFGQPLDLVVVGGFPAWLRVRRAEPHQVDDHRPGTRVNDDSSTHRSCDTRRRTALPHPENLL